METATLSYASSNKNIIVLTFISVLFHGIGLALLWQTPFFQLNHPASSAIAIQLSPSQPSQTQETATPSQPIEESSPSPSTETVTTNTRKPTPQPIVKQTPEKPHIPTPAPNKELLSQQTEMINNPQLKTENSAGVTPEPQTVQQDNIPVKTFNSPLKHSRSALRLELNKHINRTYPLMARKRGWQGKVLLGFRVTPRGEIEDIQVLNSSGHSVLDRAAIRSLSKIKQLPLAQTLLSRDLDMDLTIDYRLQDI